ncbi:MAG: DMT family transporter [Candidatus Heimdallarchaeota archaeon]|nr:DMT family transporter [Candidatus Heimdallarchaeota archaeon]
MDLLLGIVLALIASIAWGLNAIFIKRGVVDIDPYQGLFIRAIIGSPILIIISISLGNDLRIYFDSSIIGLVILSSVVVVFGDALFMKSLQKYSVTIMQPITSIYPLITTLLLIISEIEVIGLYVLIGSPIIVLGVAIVSSAGDTTGKRGLEMNALGMGLIIATLWGTAIFMIRFLLLIPEAESLGLTGVRVFIIALGAIIIYHFKPKQGIFNHPSRRSISYLSISGLLGFVIGAGSLFIAMKAIGAAITTPISSTNPIFVILFSMLFGMDKPDSRKIIGTVLSVIGTIIIVL